MSKTNKPTKVEFLKQQDDFYENHVKFHPADAFCGTTSEAEMSHINELLEQLTDSELEQLVTRGGISFGGGDIDRDTFEGVVDEISRNDFYKIYHDLLVARK